jgi:hypothetical protein
MSTVLFRFPLFSADRKLLTGPLSNRQRREHRVFEALLQMVPGLEERLLSGSEENIVNIAEMVGLLKKFTPLLNRSM